jgi:hypothetical protein
VQVLVNVSGFAALVGLALLLDAARGCQQQTSSILAAGQAPTAGGRNRERVVIARSRPEPIG